RRLHWHVGWLLALEDPVDVAGRAPVLVDHFSPVGDQPAASDEDALEVDRGQLVPGCQRDDKIATNKRQRAGSYDQTAIRFARESRDGTLGLGRIAHVDRG